MTLQNHFQRGIAFLLILGIVAGVLIAAVRLASGVMLVPSQAPQTYSATTGVTAFVYAFPEGFDIAPLHGDQNLQWNNNGIRVQDKLQLPFTDSKILHGIRRTLWSYLTSNVDCVSVLGFSASFFNKFDMFLNLCGSPMQYKVNERAMRALQKVGTMNLVRLNKTRSTLVYTTRTNLQYMLVQKPVDAADDSDLKISVLPSVPNSERTLSTLELPSQKILRLSPVDGYAAVLDHAHSGKVQLVNLDTAEVMELSAPDFGTSQIHFSPTFASENVIAFSVFEKGTWRTVAFNILARSYVTVSEQFSDQIYPTGDGGLLLVQTSIDTLGNIPFVAKSIQEEQRETALPGATLTFVKWQDGETELMQSIPVTMSVDERYFLYTRNIVALLAHLGAPKEVQTEYVSRSKFREKDRIPYEMIDWF